MTGLETPDTGNIHLAGFDAASESQKMKQAIGVLPDSLGLFDSLTVLENLLCVGPIYGLSLSQTHSRAAELLALLSLQTGRHTFAGECSYGMRKKTALAMAMLHAPRVLVLDEPFEGIDPSSSRAMERTLVQVAARGVTVLFTSHILPLVERLATRTVLLAEGAVQWDSQQMAAARPLEALYFDLVGEPPLLELPWLG